MARRGVSAGVTKGEHAEKLAGIDKAQPRKPSAAIWEERAGDVRYRVVRKKDRSPLIILQEIAATTVAQILQVRCNKAPSDIEAVDICIAVAKLLISGEVNRNDLEWKRDEFLREAHAKAAAAATATPAAAEPVRAPILKRQQQQRRRRQQYQ